MLRALLLRPGIRVRHPQLIQCHEHNRHAHPCQPCLQVLQRMRSGFTADFHLPPPSGGPQSTAVGVRTVPLLTEIVGDKHRDLVLRWSDGREETLPCRLRMADAVRCLARRLAGVLQCAETHLAPNPGAEPCTRAVPGSLVHNGSLSLIETHRLLLCSCAISSGSVTVQCQGSREHLLLISANRFNIAFCPVRKCHQDCPG